MGGVSDRFFANSGYSRLARIILAMGKCSGFGMLSFKKSGVKT